MNEVVTAEADFALPNRAADKNPIGVVIPGFGHPKFLAEAIISACEQVIDRQLYIVVVDDGCKFPETAETVQDLMRVYPGKLFYFRQKNTRLPGARNAGIHFLLKLHEAIDSIYFLDADNRLEPYSLQSFRNALGDDPKIGWAYPDIGFFGLSWGTHGFDVRETAPNYSVFKHLVANISEAGSLVRADMFKQGVFFDETMRSGFEDWDFWLSAIGAGFKGVRAQNTGFRYRRRPESMLAEARREADALLGRIRKKHQRLFSSEFVAECEHKEAPFFAVFMSDSEEVYLFSDPLVENAVISKQEFTSHIKNWLTNAREFFFPQSIVVIETATWDALRERKQFLRSLFWRLRSQGDGFEYYRVNDGPRFDILFGQASKELKREATFGAIASSTLRSLIMGDIERERAVIGRPRRNIITMPLIANNPQKIDEGGVADFPAEILPVKEKDIRHVFLSLIHDHRGFKKPLGHMDRRFAGPAAPAVREQLMPVIFGENIAYQPYVCAGPQSKRLLISSNATKLFNLQYSSFIRLLKASKDSFDEVMIALDHEREIEVKAVKIPVGDYPNITDIYTHSIRNIAQEYRAYLHRKLSFYFEHGDIYEASLVMRNAGTVFMLGDTAFLEAHGEARKNGSTGYLWLERDFFERDEELDHAIYKALAFEHALSAIVTDSDDIKARLSAYGAPVDKIKGVDDILETVFLNDDR